MGLISRMLGSLMGGSSTVRLITINELPSQLDKVREGKTGDDFFGITSSEIDCIYFVQDDGRFILNMRLWQKINCRI